MINIKYGYKINAKHKYNKRLYVIWTSMLNRVYNKNHIRYNAYVNVIVCKRWLCFDYFLEDVPFIDGWNQEKFDNKTIELDKDFKQINVKNKIYSLETCIWVDKHINNQYQPNNCKLFRAIDSNGIIYKYYSQHECARENDLCLSSISLCLNNKRKSHKGWRFEYLKETNIL